MAVDWSSSVSDRLSLEALIAIGPSIPKVIARRPWFETIFGSGSPYRYANGAFKRMEKDGMKNEMVV